MCSIGIRSRKKGDFEEPQHVNLNPSVIELTSEILAACQSRTEKITLRSMCVLSKNTEFFADKPRPILYGIAVEVHGGYCFPAKFMYKVSRFLNFMKNQILIIGTRNSTANGAFISWQSGHVKHLRL